MKKRMKASPVAQRMADHLGVSLNDLTGSGPQGRIVKSDIIKANSPTLSLPPGLRLQISSRVKLGKLRQLETELQEKTSLELMDLIVKALAEASVHLELEGFGLMDQDINLKAVPQLRGYGLLGLQAKRKELEFSNQPKKLQVLVLNLDPNLLPQPTSFPSPVFLSISLGAENALLSLSWDPGEFQVNQVKNFFEELVSFLEEPIRLIYA